MERITQINYGTILRSLLELQYLGKIICLLISFSWAKAADTYVSVPSSTSDTERYSAVGYSTAGVSNQIPLSNGKYQITFIFKHFSKSSYTTPLSIKAENQSIIDDLRNYVPGQTGKSFSLVRETQVSDGFLNIEYGSTTASVFLTMLIKKSSTTGSTPPPSTPTSPSTGNLPWLEDFNGTSYKGTIETQNIYKNGTFKVANSKLVARGVGQVAYRSEVIKLNGSTVNFSLQASSKGSLESYDNLRLYYKIDNGSEKLAGEVKGNISGTKTLGLSGVKGNTVQLIVRVRNSDISEYYYIDNVKVELAGATTPTSPSAGNLPWLEGFNAADGSHKGSLETSKMYSNAIFKVKDGKLMARGVGEVAWKSEVISLSGNTVNCSMVLSSLGNLESGYDYMRVYYKLDNGSEKLAAEAKGNISGNKTVTITGVKGSTIQLVVRIKNSDISEYYYIDNVKVELAGATTPPTSPPADNEIYQINFNGDNVTNISGWNHFNTTPTAGKKITLKNSENESSSVNVTLETSWDDYNNKGFNSGNNSGLYPDAVMKTYFCTDNQEQISISGLDSKKKYQFTFFASSMYDVDRTTEFVIGTQKVTLNAARNKNLTVTLKDVSPDSQGKVVLTVRKASGAYRGFINTLVIQTSSSTNTKMNAALAKMKNSEEPVAEILNSEFPVSFKIYPNPASDNLCIEAHDEGSYTLYSPQGNIVKEGVIKHASTECITTSGLRHGTYYLRFVTQQGAFTEKVIIHP